jgi:hypothetical protein
MTRQQLRELVRLNIARTDKDSLINSALDLALVAALSANPEWSFLSTYADLPIVSGNGSLTLPADYGALIGATLLNGTQSFKFEIRTPDYIRSQFPAPDQYPTGIPEVGYIDGGLLYLIPYSNGSYNLRLYYTIDKTSFTSDADTSPSATIDEVLVSYATSYVFSSLQLHQDAMAWLQRHSLAFKTATSRDRTQAGMTVRGEEFRYAGSPTQHGAPTSDPRDPFVGLNSYTDM